MSEGDPIVAWLTAQLDEEEWWAREASRCEFDSPTPPPTGGVHWRWVDADSDEVLPLDPALDAMLAEGGRVRMESAEEFETGSVGQLPAFAVSYCEEVRTVIAGHIVRHDPARVLREVAAKRQIIDMHEAMQAGVEASAGTVLAGAAKVRLGAYGNVLRALASAYSDRNGYQPGWAPS